MIARFGRNYIQELHSRASSMPNKIVALASSKPPFIGGFVKENIVALA